MSTKDQEEAATGNEDALAKVEEEVDRLYAQMQTPEYGVAADQAFRRRPRVRLRRGTARQPESSPAEDFQSDQSERHSIGRQHD